MNNSSSTDTLPPNAIAVIGMAARFPGADSISAFWDNLRRGEESIVTLSEERLAAAGITEEALADPAYVRRAPTLDGIDEFDAEFFGFPPQVARMMDPQHRLFLQTAWHALEDAGCDPMNFGGAIGVYATSGGSIYMLHNLLSHHDPHAILGQGATFDLINMSLQNDKDYLATRVSHQFNLRGPSITVQTACSSSMVAIHSACQSLLNGECEVALAGGVSIRIPHHVGYWHEPGSMVSGLGHCRPFDAKADGTVFGSGVAALVLKPLEAAVEEGDRIHAVIRGSAINNDGSKKMTYAAPNGAAQADVIAEAHAVAGVDPSSISYVEAHGTGTPLGDPIEMDALRKAFSVTDSIRPGPCAVGSVKSNIGHLAEASGIAGLIKTILCLKHRAIPATLHFTEPNPALDLDRGPFIVQSRYAPWDWDGIRRAGVSSFGVGGTNVHVVLEEGPSEAPEEAPVAAPQDRPGPQVLRLSARTSEALDDYRSAMAAELERDAAVDIADVAFTLAGRRTENVRLAAVVHDQQNAADVLRTPESDNVFIGESVENAGPDTDRVVFLFPGQGAQHAEMARGLYETERVFTESFDRCADGFRDELDIDLRTELFGATDSNLERTDRAQPALFAVEYALGKLIESYGVRAGAYAGHSIGEYAAATLAGVFDLPTGIQVVARRARLMHASAPGAMAAVAMAPEALAEHLSPGLDLAAVNDPGNCVVAGSQQDILDFQNRLRRQGIVARRVRTSHAFHSYLMDPVIPEFAGYLSTLTLHRPLTPMLSNVTGSWMTDDEATDPAMWASQIRSTVKFADELDLILDDPTRIVVEVGPGAALSGSAIRHPKWSTSHRAVRLMRHQVQNRSDRDTFLLAIGQLWAAGLEVDWTPLSADRPTRITLPGYPFARQRHWVDPNENVSWTQASTPTSVNGANGHSGAVTNGSSPTKTGRSDIEATLRRICAECLGVNSVAPTDNFFEIGGDSLIAIGVAMSASNQGLDLTPQDLYDNPTVSALAAALGSRYATGGLATAPSGDELRQPVPPTAADFLEHGLREAGRWRVPLLLGLDANVGVGDVASVLTAVINHHDALRVNMADHGGIWGQQFTPPRESVEVGSRALPPDIEPGSAQERSAALDIITDEIQRCDLSSPPLSATYIVDSQGSARYLGITVLELMVDSTSREILLTDMLTAFGQQFAGEDIVLPPVSATWQEWSQRCTALTAHPAVLESAGYWFDNVGKPSLRLAEHGMADQPGTADLARLQSTLTVEQITDIDRLRRRFECGVDEVLLAALSRTVAQTLGDGIVAVSLAGDGRSVFKPDIDPRRTVGGFAAIYPIPLRCVGEDGAMQILDDVREVLASVPHHGIGYGVLRHLYAPSAAKLAAIPTPDIFMSNQGVIPDLPPGQGPVHFDLDAAMPVRDKVPGLGHAIEMRVYRSSGGLHVDWWYDTRRVQPSTLATLVERYPAAVTELTADVLAAGRADGESGGAIEELGLVDLSAE
ncbi:beta-ketoacyl synthase N-terminal-like domain-containing protein [Mycolicibacterium sp. XJ870]